MEADRDWVTETVTDEDSMEAVYEGEGELLAL